MRKQDKLKVIGITSGIGSLQYGAKQAGFEVLHSHEWREYYHNGTYEKNYKKENTRSYEVDNRFVGVDLVVSHPECGNYSNLYTGANRANRESDPGDIYKFIDLASKYQPGFFLVDNLPKSLQAVTPDEWALKFKDYHIQFEMVSNWGYGNVQKNRNRLFIIGSHKDFKFHFTPGEKKHDLLLQDAIENIADDTPNHIKMKLGDTTQWSAYQAGLSGDRKLTLKELQPWLQSARRRSNMPYYNKQGELKSKPGYSVVDRDHYSPVLTGGGGLYDNHWIEDEKGYIRPLTIRERLRIQGFADDFVVTPTEFEFNSKEHQSLIKQTGKCMPVQFPTYFAKQVSDFLKNGILPEKPLRLLPQLNLQQYVRNTD